MHRKDFATDDAAAMGAHPLLATVSDRTPKHYTSSNRAYSTS